MNTHVPVLSQKALAPFHPASPSPLAPPAVRRRPRQPAWPLPLAAVLLVSAPARAAPPLQDDDFSFAPLIELRDAASEEIVDAPHGSPLWLSLMGGAALLPDGVSFNAMLVLGIPLERIGRRSHGMPAGALAAGPATAIAEGDAPTLKPAPRSAQPKSSGEPPASSDDAPKTPAAAATTSKVETLPPLELPVVVTPEVARTAVRAALKRAKLEDPSARIDALASRARAAVLLPELRFRVSRLVDEDQQLSPTEYDPGRVTASGGTSLWLEARATWRLDRLVFADDEVALERMRHDRAEAQSKLAEKVLDLLFAWQRAEALAVCPGKTPEEQLAARLKALEAKASLDILTGGRALSAQRTLAPRAERIESP